MSVCVCSRTCVRARVRVCVRARVRVCVYVCVCVYLVDIVVLNDGVKCCVKIVE